MNLTTPKNGQHAEPCPPNAPETDIRQDADDLIKILRGQLQTFESTFYRVRGFVRTNPVLGILGAVGVGILIGRLFRKSSVVYVERSKQ